MTLKEFLNYLIRLQLVASDSENLKGLLACHKTTLNSKTLLSHLFTTLVTELFHGTLILLLVNVSHDLDKPLFRSNGSDHMIVEEIVF